MFVNILKFVVKLVGLVLAPISFSYAGYFLAFMGNNEVAYNVVIFAMAGFGLMMLNHMLGNVKSIGWAFGSMATMVLAGISVVWSAVSSADPVAHFFANAFVFITGMGGFYYSYLSYQEPKPKDKDNED